MTTVPGNLIGPAAQVRTDARRRVRSFLTDGLWRPFDERTPSDALVVLSPMPAIAAEEFVRPYLAVAPLVDAITAGTLDPRDEEAAVAGCLGDPFGVLALLAPPNQLLIHPTHRHRPLVDAAARFWPELDRMRYTLGTTDGAQLWDLPTNLQYALANLGVAAERLRTPLPPGGPGALLS
jgi:hypothetical protein